ncbi:MAG TPA: sugar ABC transporter substrate-binding protein, partial [Candidatus Binatia bacterium]
SIRGDGYGEVEAWMKPHFQAVMEALGHGVFRKNVPYWAEFERIINEAFIRTVVERQSVDEILNVLHKRLEAVKAGS